MTSEFTCRRLVVYPLRVCYVWPSSELIRTLHADPASDRDHVNRKAIESANFRSYITYKVIMITCTTSAPVRSGRSCGLDIDPEVGLSGNAAALPERRSCLPSQSLPGCISNLYMRLGAGIKKTWSLSVWASLDTLIARTKTEDHRRNFAAVLKGLPLDPAHSVIYSTLGSSKFFKSSLGRSGLRSVYQLTHVIHTRKQAKMSSCGNSFNV